MIYYIVGIVIGLIGLTLLFGKKIKIIKKDIALQKELEAQQKGINKSDTADDDIPMQEINSDLTQKKRLPDLVETLKRAETLFSRGELDDAEKCFIKALSLKQDHTDAMNKLGIIYLKQKNYPKAELILKKLVDLQKTNPIYFSNLGIALYKQNKLNEAVVAYEKSIECDDSRPARFISLGQVYFELDNLEQSQKYFREAFKRDLKNIELCFQIIEIAKMREDVENQKKYLDKILALDPYNEEAKDMLANLKE